MKKTVLQHKYDDSNKTNIRPHEIRSNKTHSNKKTNCSKQSQVYCRNLDGKGRVLWQRRLGNDVGAQFFGEKFHVMRLLDLNGVWFIFSDGVSGGTRTKNKSQHIQKKKRYNEEI